MAASNLHPVIKRLALREYLPFGSMVLSWFLIGLSVGHADLVRLIGAMAFVQGVRSLCTLELMDALARRSAAAAEVWKQSRRTAVGLDLLALVAAALLLAGIVSLIALRDMPRAAAMVAIAALSIPARQPFGLLVAKGDRQVTWRVGAAATAVTGAAIVFAFGLSWQAASLVIALREWGGLVATLLFAPARDTPKSQRTDPITFAEAAAQTEAVARRQLSYRLVKTLSAAAFGPLGNFGARTGRGAGRMDVKLSRLMPRNRPGMALFTLGCVSGSLALLFASREPLAFLVAGSAARIAGSGCSALLWWRYWEPPSDEDEDLDD